MKTAPQNNLRILVADNERLIQKLVCNVLVSLGFTNVFVVNSGRQAIDMIAEKPFDLIITDWRMDNLDGIDVIRFVRSSPYSPMPHIPIIMLTGNTEGRYVREAINAGVNCYLIKPFSAVQLMKRIRLVIENPRDFIISPNYKGPDRRHLDHDDFDLPERRRTRREVPKIHEAS